MLSVDRGTGQIVGTFKAGAEPRDGDDILPDRVIRTSDALDDADSDTPQGLLKGLTGFMPDPAILYASFRDAAARDRAEGWRKRLEGRLALHLGGGAKGEEGAAILFAAWQGDLLWRAAGGKGFRLKDAAKRIG